MTRIRSWRATVVFDPSAQGQLDMTTPDVIRSLLRELDAMGIEALLADVHALKVDDAVAAFRAREPERAVRPPSGQRAD